MTDEKTLAEVAYEAECQIVGTYPHHVPLARLSERERESWEVAAAAVEREVVARLAAQVGPLTMTAEEEADLRGPMPHYGYPTTPDPRLFQPDTESCTANEIARHKAACEAWDRGERPEPETTEPDAMLIHDGKVVHACGHAWGIGSSDIPNDGPWWAEIDALRASLAARDAEIGRLTGERDIWKERSVSGADLIDTMTQQRADGERRADALLSAALARAVAAERGRDEMEHEAEVLNAGLAATESTVEELRERYPHHDETCEGGCDEGVVGHDSEGVPLCRACLAGLLRESWTARYNGAVARVASLESALTRERAAHAALREAAERMADTLDIAKIGGKAVHDLRAALAALRGEEKKT